MSVLPQISVIPRRLKLNETDSHYMNKLMRTVALFTVFVAFGIARSLQGPTLLELQKQVGVNIEMFQIVFLLGAVTFPAGNILAGFIMEHLNASLFLSISTVALALSFCCIPFTPSIGLLAAASGVAELALGLIDTGANVHCLDLWDTKSGPYFNALHLSQSLGFLMSPILAETILVPMHKGESIVEIQLRRLILEGIQNLTIASNLTSVLTSSSMHNIAINPSEILALPMMPLHSDVLSVTRFSEDVLDFDAFSPVQGLYLGIGCCIFFVALIFLAGIPSDSSGRTGSYTFDQSEAEFEKPEKAENKKTDSLDKLYNSSCLIFYSVVFLMTLYCACVHGLSFAYGHFLTAYAVKSSYALTAAEGARLTSIYYAAQVVVRAINIPLILRVSRFRLVSLYLAFAAIGSGMVLLPEGGLWGLRLGSVLIGLGAGSLFPVGLLWIQGELGVNSRLTSLFCLGTSLGAQLFRLPEAAYLDEVPSVHVYLLATAVATAIGCFIGMNVLLKWSKELKSRAEDRIVVVEKS